MLGYLPLRRPIVFPSVNLSCNFYDSSQQDNCHHDHNYNTNHDHTYHDNDDDKPRSVWRSIRLLKNSSLAGTLFVTCGLIFHIFITMLTIIIHHIYHPHILWSIHKRCLYYYPGHQSLLAPTETRASQYHDTTFILDHYYIIRLSSFTWFACFTGLVNFIVH